MTIFYVLKASTKQEKAIIIDEKVNNKNKCTKCKR